jgi:hypothetical protein
MTDIITSTTQLPSISELGEVDANYIQINAQRQVQGPSFTAGVIDYAFSLAGNQRASMKKSYFRMRAKLTAADGVTKPTIADKVAFAEGWANNLFSSVYAYAGGVDISSKQNFCAQSTAARTRLKSTNSWYESIGEAFGWDPSFTKRAAKVASDGASELNYLAPRTPGTDALAETVDITTAGVATFSAPVPFSIGSTFIADGTTFTIVAFLDTTGTSYRVDPAPAVALTAEAVTVPEETDFKNLFIVNFDDEKNEVEIAFQPGALGLWETESALPSGSYRMSLYPTNDRELTPAVEAKTPIPFKVTVEDLYLYLYTFRAVEPIIDDTYFLDLAETQVQTKTLSATDNNFNLTIPASTYGIAVWVQPKASGTGSGTLPPNIFRDDLGELLKVSNIQLTYAGISKPSTDWDSALVTPKNWMKQRYLNTYEHAGMEECSAESYSDFLDRGPIYYWSWYKSDSNRSTELQLSLKFKDVDTDLFPDSQVFVCAFYRNLVEVNVVSGYITSVRKLAM